MHNSQCFQLDCNADLMNMHAFMNMQKCYLWICQDLFFCFMYEFLQTHVYTIYMYLFLCFRSESNIHLISRQKHNITQPLDEYSEWHIKSWFYFSLIWGAEFNDKYSTGIYIYIYSKNHHDFDSECLTNWTFVYFS